MGEAKRRRLQHQAGDSDSRVFHFTTISHLPWILSDGAITQSRHIRRLPGKGVVWFTTDGRKPDRTSAASYAPHASWARFSAPLDATLPWQEGCRAAGWTDDHIKLALVRSREFGANPDERRVTVEPYRLPTLIVDIFQKGQWTAWGPGIAISPDRSYGVVGSPGQELEVRRIQDAFGAFQYVSRIHDGENDLVRWADREGAAA